MCRFDFLNTVKIVVGECKIEFAVPKNLMIQRSRVFASRNKEGSIDKPFDLHGVEKEDLPRYLQLLYSGQVVLFSDEDNADAKQKWRAIINLYDLARTFEDGLSGNLISDEMVRLLHQGSCCLGVLRRFGGSGSALGFDILIDFVVEKLGAGDLPLDLHKSKEGVFILREAVTELLRRKRSGEQRPKQNTTEGMKRYHKSVE